MGQGAWGTPFLQVARPDGSCPAVWLARQRPQTLLTGVEARCPHQVPAGVVSGVPAAWLTDGVFSLPLHVPEAGRQLAFS